MKEKVNTENKKNILEEKDRLRKKFLDARKTLSPSERESNGKDIAEKVRTLPEYRRAKNIHIYLSLENEVGTREIIARAIEDGKQVAVPTIDTVSDEIRSAELKSPDEPTRRGALGVEEPINYIPFDSEKIDLAIVPGVAFDKLGNRIGFGRGYYDRFLKNLQAIKAGIGYSCQISKSKISSRDADVPLDFVITEKEIFFRSFSPGEGLLPAERKKTLAIARDALKNFFRSGEIPEMTPKEEWLLKPRGAFVTLKIRGELRGCIGYIQPVKSLAQTAADCACHAAFEDFRFPSLQETEMKNLTIEISVLSSPVRIDDPQDVEIGLHGLIVSNGYQRGLLLPQVATEHDMTREEFIEHTCLKAGLSQSALKDPKTALEVFTAQVFGENDF